MSTTGKGLHGILDRLGLFRWIIWAPQDRLMWRVSFSHKGHALLGLIPKQVG